MVFLVHCTGASKPYQPELPDLWTAGAPVPSAAMFCTCEAFEIPQGSSLLDMLSYY